MRPNMNSNPKDPNRPIRPQNCRSQTPGTGQQWLNQSHRKPFHPPNPPQNSIAQLKLVKVSSPSMQPTRTEVSYMQSIRPFNTSKRTCLIQPTHPISVSPPAHFFLTCSGTPHYTTTPQTDAPGPGRKPREGSRVGPARLHELHAPN